MTEQKRDQLVNGIRAYGYQQRVLLRLLRRHGPLHQDGFDRLFHRKRFPPVFFTGETFVLGFCQNPSDWAKWLQLLQIMVAIGLVNQRGETGEIEYFLPEPERKHET